MRAAPDERISPAYSLLMRDSDTHCLDIQTTAQKILQFILKEYTAIS